MGLFSSEKIQKKVERFDDGTTLAGLESDYDIKNLEYFDKGGHKERSIKNEPNHLAFWQRQEP